MAAEKVRTTRRTLMNYLGLLGIVSLLSYTAAVVLSPLSYPGYNWMTAAVSDLSAESAPSRTLWKQLAALFMPCGIVCCTLCSVAVGGRYSRTLRLGVYLFTVMNWVSAIGYAAFPLTEAGRSGGFQNTMHLVVTALVVVLAVVSLTMMIIGGSVYGSCHGLTLFSALALFFMILGAVGVMLFPPRYFGLFERFSTFSSVAFNAVLGILLYKGFEERA